MPVIKKMPRALVAGCAGFIGSHLVESLLQKDILVTGVDNLSTGKKIYLEHSFQNSNFKFIQFDLNNGIPKEIKNQKFDYIFHLASTESHTREDIENIEYEILLTNSLTTRNLLEFAKKNNSKFVLASSLEIYQGFVSSVGLENYFGSSIEEEKTFSYSEAKRFAEALVWQFYKKNGLDVRIVRLSEVYGPRMNLKSTASLGTFLDYFLHEQDLIVSGDGLTKERYAYVTDAVNLLESSMLNKNGTGLILPLVPNLTTPLEIAYLLKDMSQGKLDILFRPSKKVDIIPTVEKIDVSSLDKIGYEIKTSFKDGIIQTIQWFGKLTKDSDDTIEKVKTKKPIQTPHRINPNENIRNKFHFSINKKLKKVAFIIAITLLLTGIFIVSYQVFFLGKVKVSAVNASEYLDYYNKGEYQNIINSNSSKENPTIIDGILGQQANSNADFSASYLVNYIKYISKSKQRLLEIYSSIFSKQSQSNNLVRISTVIANIDAANRYLLLYQSSLNGNTSKIDINKEMLENKKLSILANNTAELFSGDKKYLIITTNSSKSAYFLGKPLKQYIFHIKDYNFQDLSEVNIIIDPVSEIDFAEYATNYISKAKTKLNGNIDGVLFIDNTVLNNFNPIDFAYSIITKNKTNLDSLSKAIKERKLIFFPTSSDVTIAGDLGITPVLAFSDSSDFIITTLENTGGTNSKLYLISNLVYTLTENTTGYLASLTLTMLHTGSDLKGTGGVFSGNVNLLFPSFAKSFDIKSNGSFWKRGLEYQLIKSKYDTNLITYPTIIAPGDSNTVTITYHLTKPADSGYNLIIPKIANVKVQNFTLKFRPLSPNSYNLKNFENDGGVYQYTTTQTDNLLLKF